MVVTPAAVAAAPYKRLDESVCAGENWKTFAKLSSDGRYFDIAALLVDRDVGWRDPYLLMFTNTPTDLKPRLSFYPAFIERTLSYFSTSLA